VTLPNPQQANLTLRAAVGILSGILAFFPQAAAGQEAKPAQAKSQSASQSASRPSQASQVGTAIPDIRALIVEVMDHQKQLEKVRENYTYRTSIITQDIDSNGQVKKTETEDSEVFFVNSHHIERTTKKDGKPLDEHDQKKEQERVLKLVEKAQKTPPGEPLEGPNTNVSISHLLEIMEVSNPRRESFRGRPTIIFDFAGRRDAKTHGFAEDASKKIAGTLWVDERDREVARMEAHFTDNFHVGGGLVANVQKGSSFYFDQAPVNGEIWFPTNAEGHVTARVLLLKGYREHFTERDYDYERFSVNTEAGKTVTVVSGQKVKTDPKP
jgi:hypothetical protein